MNAKKCTSFIDCAEPKTLVLEKKGYQINQCNTCGHRFAKVSQDVSNHLAEVYSDKYFFEGKDGYPNYLKEKGLLYKSGIRYAKILSKYTKPGTVLDVGCAAGFILKGFEDSGWQCKGLEPNDTMASYGRKELKLDIVTGGLENFKTPQKFDLVNIIQVMGSLYDTDKSLAAVAALVKQGGLIMVESWDMDSTAARKLGKNWHEYCPPTIINWFSDKTLQQAFNYYGMELVAQGRPSKWINVNHGISLFAESSPNFIFKKPFLKCCSFFFGKLNVPYPAIDLKWYLFKKI